MIGASVVARRNSEYWRQLAHGHLHKLLINIGHREDFWQKIKGEPEKRFLAGRKSGGDPGLRQREPQGFARVMGAGKRLIPALGIG